MKKILLSIIMVMTLLTVSVSASEIEMSKQEMMRDSKPPRSELVSINDSEVSKDSNTLALIFAVAVIMILVGLLSTFVTRYALSIKEKNNSIYQKKQEDKNNIEEN